MNKIYIPSKTRDLHGGTQEIYRFPNHYGASVVCHEHSYGGKEGFKELAVVEFMTNSEEFSLTYDTPITNAVLGWLGDEEVTTLLAKIEKLPLPEKYLLTQAE